MGLMKGGAPVQEQVMDTAMSAEQQRELKLGLIVVKLRRWWRIFCIAMFVIGSIIGIVQSFTTGDSILAVIALCAVGWGLTYVIVLYLFLYILIGRTVQLFLYLKDLFGGNKETRL